MWKKLGRLIINNFGLKVLAVVFAVIVWLVIVNTVDPDKTATFTIPIEIVNADYLAEEGKTYEVLDNTETISFTVNGKRSIVENLTADDFRAVANMQNIDATMTMVPITLTATSYNSQLEIVRMQDYLMVSVENLVTREFEINIAVEGSPAGNHFVSSLEITPTSVTVTGPESAVDEVAYAQSMISVNGAEETFTSEETVFLMNENGIVLDEERMDVSVTQADVTANILMVKTVPISFEVTGEPAEGYWAEAPQCDIDSLTIAGQMSTLEAIDELVFSSPALSVEGADEDILAVLPVGDMLPDGVSLYEDQPDELSVLIPVEPSVTIYTEIPADNISFPGLADDLTATISIDPLTVTVTGLEEDVNSLRLGNLAGSVDATDLGVGNYLFTIDLETNGECRAQTTFSVSITEKEEESNSGILAGLLAGSETEAETEEDTETETDTDTDIDAETSGELNPDETDTTDTEG